MFGCCWLYHVLCTFQKQTLIVRGPPQPKMPSTSSVIVVPTPTANREPILLASNYQPRHCTTLNDTCTPVCVSAPRLIDQPSTSGTVQSLLIRNRQRSPSVVPCDELGNVIHVLTLQLSNQVFAASPAGFIIAFYG